MNTNMFEDYYNYKIKTVISYSLLLSKIIGIKKNKLWNKRRNTEKILEWIVNDYFNNLESNNNKNNLVRCFINDKDIFKYKIDNELYSVINYFIENKRGFEIAAYEKEIVLTSCILNIANNLDISSSPYKENRNNYKTILLSYIEKFNKIPYLSIIDDDRKNMELLLELIKTNIRKERRIYELLDSKTSFNKYIDISSDNKYYLVSYNYSVQGIKSIHPEAVKYVYDHSDYDDEFVLISRDLVIVTLMKLFSIRKLRSIFFLPTKLDFLVKEKNLKELKNTLNNKLVNKYLKVLVNYNDYNDEIKSLLKKYDIDYYLYCSKNTIYNKGLDENNYLFSNDFNLLNNGLYEDLINEDKNVILEKYEGIKLDKNLVDESEEL